MAKKVLVDTNVLILGLSGEGRYGELLEKLIKEDRLVLSVIVVIEFLTGAKESEIKIFEALLTRFGAVEVDVEMARMAAFYRKNFLKLKRKVYLPDCVLAATCKLNDYKLATLNKKDYPMKDIEFCKL